MAVVAPPATSYDWNSPFGTAAQLFFPAALAVKGWVLAQICRFGELGVANTLPGSRLMVTSTLRSFRSIEADPLRVFMFPYAVSTLKAANAGVAIVIAAAVMPADAMASL